jgi:hypothetical protein
MSFRQNWNGLFYTSMVVNCYVFYYSILDKSFDLKYVIQQMLDPDPKSRPTVDQVLAFPYVRKVSLVNHSNTV